MGRNNNWRRCYVLYWELHVCRGRCDAFVGIAYRLGALSLLHECSKTWTCACRANCRGRLRGLWHCPLGSQHLYRSRVGVWRRESCAIKSSEVRCRSDRRRLQGWRPWRTCRRCKAPRWFLPLADEDYGSQYYQNSVLEESGVRGQESGERLCKRDGAGVPQGGAHVRRLCLAVGSQQRTLRD